MLQGRCGQGRITPPWAETKTHTRVTRELSVYIISGVFGGADWPVLFFLEAVLYLKIGVLRLYLFFWSQTMVVADGAPQLKNYPK